MLALHVPAEAALASRADRGARTAVVAVVLLVHAGTDGRNRAAGAGRQPGESGALRDRDALVGDAERQAHVGADAALVAAAAAVARIVVHHRVARADAAARAARGTGAATVGAGAAAARDAAAAAVGGILVVSSTQAPPQETRGRCRSSARWSGSCRAPHTMSQPPQLALSVPASSCTLRRRPFRRPRSTRRPSRSGPDRRPRRSRRSCCCRSRSSCRRRRRRPLPSRSTRRWCTRGATHADVAAGASARAAVVRIDAGVDARAAAQTVLGAASGLRTTLAPGAGVRAAAASAEDRWSRRRGTARRPCSACRCGSRRRRRSMHTTARRCTRWCRSRSG